jgi:hypothetical protein
VALSGISAELAALPWDFRERTAEERMHDRGRSAYSGVGRIAAVTRELDAWNRAVGEYIVAMTREHRARASY